MADFPQDVSTKSTHIGAIGEVLFTKGYGVPPPVREAVLNYCMSACPLEVGEDDVFIDSREVEPYTIYVAEHEEEWLKWKPDAYLVAVAGDDETDWLGRFPIEIKTGSASLKQNQRETIQYLARCREPPS